MSRTISLVLSLATSVLMLSSPHIASAQNDSDWRLRNSVTVQGGAFVYDLGGDSAYPLVTAALGRSLSRFVEIEGLLSYARLTTKVVSLAPTVRSYDARTPFLAADAAANLLLPLGRFVPYVGISAGVFRRNATRDESNAVYLDARKGTSMGAAVGARWLFTPRVGLRGEFRYRQDSHDGSDYRANDMVESIGLMYRF